ncbi:MAG: nitroreductase family protein [Lachnospiraceae bacterium]|nr:nitroreductase family protein [Lachnospiraceae bacterium]
MADIFHRVSVRNYQDKPVEQDKIEKLLRAAMAAPSATNQQPWEFYVVTDRATIDAMADSSPYSACMKKAPLSIVTCYRTNCNLPEFAEIDLAIATENLWLMADELGLGAVWLGTAPLPDRMEDIGRILNLPSDVKAFAVMSIGYPEGERPQQDRYDQSRVHYI